MSSITTSGRYDYGSDEFIVSPTLAEAETITGIVKITLINKISLEVAVKDERIQDSEGFPFSGAWTTPQIIIHLTSGMLALMNISFLIAGDDLS